MNLIFTVLQFQTFDFIAQVLRGCREKKLRVGEQTKPFILHLFVLQIVQS